MKNIRSKNSTKDIRVLHLVHRFAVGGAEAVLVNLCKHSDIKINNKILSFTDYDKDFVKHVNRAEQLTCLNKKEGNDFSLLKKVSNQIHSQSSNIVHAQGWGTYIEGLIATKILTRHDCRFIYAFHGKTAKDVSHGISWRQRTAQKMASFFSDAIIAPSYHMANDYAVMMGVPREKISVIYNGIDVERFSNEVPGIRTDIAISRNAFVVGYVGRLDPVKNIKGLITSFRIFLNNISAAERHNVKLVIVGDGEEKETIYREIKNMELKHNVVLLGQRNDIPACLGAMDVYIQSSFYEGHSNTILEAMVSGLPVISTRVGGTPEIIDDTINGYLFAPDEQHEMAGQILKLYRDKGLREAIGHQAKQTVYDRFSVQKMVESYKTLYMKVLDYV